MTQDDVLVIAGRSIRNRFFLGTGKFSSRELVGEAIRAAGIEVVTVALRRIEPERRSESILHQIPAGVVRLVNTSGARDAQEALRLARLARATGLGDWIKVEVVDDSKYLLPDNDETVRATELLTADGFVVLPYIFPDLYIARRLQRAGAAALMPLGSPIGSNQGLQTREFIRILIAETGLPVIVDAGLGAPSQAAESMEMGAAAVLANTAVATAADPVQMARAFSLAVAAGRAARLAGLPPPGLPSASSPMSGFLTQP
ncbi:MAG: thiazole synthase [Candidatus Aminicenantes bacterium]|nr:thiazole synthase [Acidobacteriota bacterium]MCG2810229.1 thiazole synthase [Candidatus Aminicenantes bacterium]